MSEIPKAYEPQAVEKKWYEFWLAKGCFTANPHSTKPAYSIVIPPPNVTGVLTLGHVLNNTIQDILARKARMEGREVLWLPGTDHAGIATQTVVERTLKKSGEIKHRDDLGREKFLEKVWQWKEKHGGIIIEQLKRLGASCDWTRERFTMDAAYSRCVQDVFVRLYQQGLIYRGKRMVNWCPASLTALSDEEVNMKEQNGFLYYFKVEIAEEPGTFLTIATTRPETIPGDAAIAVNPKDPRYAKYIGRFALRPLPEEAPFKRIPIIGDEAVDFAFGTGVLKVTPAHDKTDFEIGARHHLPAPEVIGANGQMTEAAGVELRGLDRFQARKKAVEKLRELGALEKEEPYVNNVGFSERADVPIEPRLSEQWFLKYPCADEARNLVASGGIAFYPERWSKVYDHWMGGIKDWCISRQLWWGHRVPVWYRKSALAEGRETSTLVNQNEIYVGVTPPENAEEWVQDPDVLDTWFSSWLWPFATMGWPEKTAELSKFYPTTDLVTGPDILFFWVARMIMAGCAFMEAKPFQNVYFTGIIRDKQGRKMSKSLGNSPDPLTLIDKFGADALRFGVMRSAPLGQDVLFDEQQVELGRNFCNKLWNACRFRQMQAGAREGEILPVLLSHDDKWILLKLNAAMAEVTTALSQYKFNEAAQVLYRFFWSEYCDWYLEASKSAVMDGDEEIKTNTLAVIDFILSHMLRLFHPFMPFITEELWHGLGYDEEMPAGQGGETILFAPWPKPFGQDFLDHYGLDAASYNLVEGRNQMITQGRNLRQTGNIPASRKVKFVLTPTAEFSAHDLAAFRQLLNAESVEVVDTYQPPLGTPAVHSELGHLYLPLAGLVDVVAEKARLQKELERNQLEITKVEQKLRNPAFTEKVPASVLAEHQQRLADWQEKRAQLQCAWDALIQ